MDWIAEEYDRGSQQALVDIASGCPKLYWQTRGSWGKLFVQLMANRFAVAVQQTFDLTSRENMSFEVGYNEAIAAYVDRSFGTGSYNQVLDEVEQFRDDQYRRYFESIGRVARNNALD
jgi:hypothetical protein